MEKLYNPNTTNLPEFEVPWFEYSCGGWSVATRWVLIWKIWPDDRNLNPYLFEEAKKATQKIIETGRPLFGGLR